MKITRIGRAGSAAVVAALALAACGSASNDDAKSTSPAGTSGSSAAAADCFTGSLTGAGSTAQGNAITQAIASYGQKCSGAKVSYNGTGSGAGVTSFIAKQVGFAGSDSALSPDKGEPDKAKAACGSDALNIPMVTGPIAVAFNVKGIDKLNLSAATIAQIFSGKITTWNDPAIAKENSGASLPSTKISVFFRSDSSGTTDNFTKYLNTAAKTDWPAEHSKSWTGKVGQGKAKSAGVSQAVSSTDGGITYVEWSYAITDNLKMAAVDNGAGPVTLSADSAGKAVAAAKVASLGGQDLTLKLDYATKEAGAYPIILVTYEIVCSKYPDAATGKAVNSFVSYLASDDFQGSLTKVGSAPLPTEILTKVQAAAKSIS